MRSCVRVQNAINTHWDIWILTPLLAADFLFLCSTISVSMTASTAWWFSTICLSVVGLPVGLIFFSLGIATRARHQPYSGGTQTVGTVTNLTRDYGDGGTAYRPEVTFRTAEGELIVFNGTCSSVNAPNIGEEVRVSYIPSEPSEARNLDSSCKRSAFVAIVVGVVLVLCAAIFISRLAFGCIRWNRCTERFRAANANSGTDELRSPSEALGCTPSSPRSPRSEAIKVWCHHLLRALPQARRTRGESHHSS